MLFGMLFIVFVDFVLVCLDFYIKSDTQDTGIITVSLMVFYAYYIAYYGIKQSKVLIPLFLTESQQQLDVAGLPKAATPIQNALSSESKESIIALKSELVKALEVDQLYLDEELTLSKLAKAIATTDKKLSTLLNQEMNTTFYDFINKYRVQSVKDKIADETFSHYTLLAIGYESGFKSKTSFNRIFKKEVGISPSEFKKQLAKSKL
jgi:AraC-like DNA-binding protein